jgi:predicted transposase YdaD
LDSSRPRGFYQEIRQEESTGRRKSSEKARAVEKMQGELLALEVPGNGAFQPFLVLEKLLEYLSTFTKFTPNITQFVGKYAIHRWSIWEWC